MANKKILLISGSPRKGNTEYIISRLNGVVEGDKTVILLREKTIERCRGCLACHYKPECLIKDDVMELINQILVADILVIGVPNYFENVAGLMKDFIDRLHPLYKTKIIKDKRVVLFMVGGGKAPGNQEVLERSMQGFIKHYGVKLVAAFGFQALNPGDLGAYPENEIKILEMVKVINEL
jgi:multimeric flavodoxin WrbA